MNAQQALEAMRFLFDAYIKRSPRDVFAGVLLAELDLFSEDGVLPAEWGEAVRRASGGDRVVAWPHNVGDAPQMVGAAEISITVAQALMATRVYVAGWVGRGDMELHLVHGQTEIASDGMTMDPAAWHDWLDAI